MPTAKVSVYRLSGENLPPALSTAAFSPPPHVGGGGEEGEKYRCCVSSCKGANPNREDPHDLAD